ncbi:MAG: sensor histidine kinase [Crocinitomicaceae bacterium]|jgi:signal transduction histidine kinase|nr:sensor histidine kinase [Crocinitomicaceae bacterium]
MKTADTKFDLVHMEVFMCAVQELYLAKDLESIARIACTAARKLTGAEGAAFVLREENQCYFMNEDAVSPLWKGSYFTLQNSVDGWAMLNSEPVMIEDIYQDERISPEDYQGTFVKSMMSVPVRREDSIAAIGNYWAKPHAPSKEKLTWVRALADAVSCSIENVKLINKLKQEAAELAESLTREKKLNKMKSALVSMASHEFRTPLTTILSSTLLVEKYIETNQPEKSEKHFERIRSSVNNLTGLLNDFLVLEKLEEGKMEIKNEMFDLDSFLQDLVDEFEGIKKNGQGIRYSFEGEAEIFLDKKILKNILINLLSNAIKYSHKDIELRARSANGEIIIAVEDHGIGIPQDQHQQMFSKFFRASNTTEIQGIGLGMNIVSHYMELLSGTIDFVSVEGEGTTFTIQLPIKKNADFLQAS